MNDIDLALRLDRGDFRLDARLNVPASGVTALFGASGAGKSTLLRAIAGLEPAVRGRIAINTEVWLDSDAGVSRPAHVRAVGYVFQEASLLPHLDVRRNIEYGWRRVPAGQRRIDYDAVVEWTGVRALLARRVQTLSGGERNRVAIARALLSSPALLLLDEPLAALDGRARTELLRALERLHRELAIPIMYVSHSLDEVARLADRLAYIEAGRVVACGPITEMMTRLDLPFVDSDDAGAVIEATVSAHDERFHLSYLSFNGAVLSVPGRANALGSVARLRILARDVSLSLVHHRDTSILNVIAATITEISGDRPAHVTVKLHAGKTPLLARITRKSAHELDLKPGMGVFAQVKSVAVMG